MIEWKGGKKTWETTKNLTVVAMIDAFVENDQDSEDEVYEVKVIEIRLLNQFGHKWCRHRLDMGGGTNVPPHKKTEKTRDFEKKLVSEIW